MAAILYLEFAAFFIRLSYRCNTSLMKFVQNCSELCVLHLPHLFPGSLRVKRLIGLISLALFLSAAGCAKDDPNTRLKPVDPNIPFPTASGTHSGGGKGKAATPPADSKDKGDKTEKTDKDGKDGKDAPKPSTPDAGKDKTPEPAKPGAPK